MSSTAGWADEAVQSCEPSVWSLVNQNLRRDGSFGETPATSTRYCFLGGSLEMDEFRALGSDGEIVFRGVSFSYPLDGAEPNRTLWVMVGDPGHTLIENRVSGTGLVSTGEGVDGLGRFEEKSTTIHPSPTSFRFEMSRKYSSIGRWLEPFNIIEGRRTKETPPELPGQAAETFEKLTGLLEEDTAAAPSRVSTFILDGHAHLRVVSGASSDDPDGSPILRYSVPTGDDELLVHEWRLGETQLESLRLSLDERSPESGQAGSP